MLQPQDYTYENWISQFKSMNKLSEQLQFILTILNSLEGDIQKEFHDEIVEFEGYYMDDNFMRKVKERDAIISENPAEYYGRDFGNDDPYKYDKQVERKITEISMNIMATLGRIIKLMKSKEFFIGEDM